jgi:hypothetical protein
MTIRAESKVIIATRSTIPITRTSRLALTRTPITSGSTLETLLAELEITNTTTAAIPIALLRFLLPGAALVALKALLTERKIIRATLLAIPTIAFSILLAILAPLWLPGKTTLALFTRLALFFMFSLNNFCNFS